MKFSIYQESRRGGRKYNQDRLGYSYSRDTLLLVIADGMGGHLQGEIAAQIAVELLIKRFEKHARPAIKDPSYFLYESIHHAHDAIISYATDKQLLETPRTTIVACIIQDNMAYWAHVGDSRLYIFHAGEVSAVTMDHSRVQQLVNMGKITAEEAEVHPEKNKIYNCLGSMIPPEVELSPRKALHEADTVILCTDGFWGSLTKSEMEAAINQFPVLYAVPKLMDKAELRAGKYSDNISALGITWHEEDDGTGTTTQATSTLKMNPDTVTTQLDTLQITPELKASGEVTDIDIEKAIAEIQSTIQKSFGKLNG